MRTWKHYIYNVYGRLIGLSLIICHLSFSPAGAQGLPLIRNYTVAEYGGHNRCYDIETDKDGTIYVANFEGLLYYDRAQWRMLYTPDISRITAVYRDSKNTIWVGGYHFLARLERRANGQLFMRQVDAHTAPAEVQGTDVETAVASDSTQTERLDGGLLVKVRKNNGLSITDEQGRELYTLTEANGLCSNQIAHIVYDGHGVLWGATAHGIFAVEIPSVYSYLLAKDGLNGEVHAITAFDGKIYAGGTNGLYSVSARKLQYISDINNICWTLCHYGNQLLAATSSGIFGVKAGGSVVRLTSNATTAMLVDDDKVYAGEPDGVWLYQHDFKQRTKVSDLQLVTAIRKNAQGGLFLQNVHGKSEGKAPTDNSRRSPLTIHQTLLKTLSDIEIGAHYQDGTRLWIGGDEVLAAIDTDQQALTRLTDCRTLRFRSITMAGDSVLWGGYGTMPKELQPLGSDEGHLHFYYALDYSPLSGNTLYRYRLNDNAWSPWTEKQDVEFLNLPYGAFTLSVQAQLANGELSDVAAIDFSIRYPLFMRWYMVVLYFFFSAYIVWQLFRYRLRRLQKDKLKLEKVIEARTADLRNAQHELIRQEKMASVGKLTEGLIDRILNPMNYIINFSKMSNDLLKDLKENIDHNKDSFNADDYEDTLDVMDMLTENLQNVDQYGQNTTRTLKAMEEMLKDRAGGFVDMDLLPVLQQDKEMLVNYYAKELEQHHIRLTFDLPNAPMPMHGNPELLSKSIMSILGNAVYAVMKKAQKATLVATQEAYAPEIAFSASVAMLPETGEPMAYVLTIHDNGIGIEERILDKIFDPFFTTKTTDEAAGVGLYLTREIIQNHVGDISVQSVKDEYTVFTITLPIVS